jgi:hypothetical protein
LLGVDLDVTKGYEGHGAGPVSKFEVKSYISYIKSLENLPGGTTFG